MISTDSGTKTFNSGVWTSVERAAAELKQQFSGKKWQTGRGIKDMIRTGRPFEWVAGRHYLTDDRGILVSLCVEEIQRSMVALSQRVKAVADEGGTGTSGCENPGDSLGSS